MIKRLTRSITAGLAALAFFASATIAVEAQFLKVPKIKDIKPKDVPVQTPSTTVANPSSGSASTNSSSQSSLYGQVHVLRRTISVEPRRFTRFWKNPAASEPVYDTFSWAPEIAFSIHGPVAAGSKIYIEWETADGKPWFTQRMTTPTLSMDSYDEVKHVEDLNFDALEKKAITTASGLFPFRIRLKNPVEGTDTVLFAGKYKLATYTPDPKIVSLRGKKEFFIDEDWRIPMAWVWLNPTNNEKAPILNTQMWFKASESSDDFEAFLFYNGKQIRSIKAGSADENLTNAGDEKPYRYSLRTFFFSNVRGWNNAEYPDQYRDSHFLDKNPGEYEIKILRNGELARHFEFTVGRDGKIVDNGYARNNKVGGTRWIIPTKILGTADGTVNAQSAAFYGNPLVGFTN